MKPMVIVCGLPSSGNKIFAKCLIHNGAATWIVHGTTGPKGTKGYQRSADMVRDLYQPGETFALMPVRSVPHQRRSQQTNHKWSAMWSRTRLTKNVTEVLIELDIPLYHISYEGFVEYPELHLQSLCVWFGLKYVGLPTEIKNGNKAEKYDAIR